MKRTILSFFLFSFAISMFGQISPNAEYWTSKRWKPKQWEAPNFRKAAAEKTQKFNNTAETAIVTYRVADGPDQGMFERVVPSKTRDFFYSEGGDPAQFEYWRDNVGPYVETSEGQQTWWRIKDWCNNWTDGGKPAKHLSVTTIVVETGKEDIVRRYLNRVAKIRSTHNPSRGIAVFKLASGGQLNTFRIVNFFDDPSQARGEWTSENSFEDEYNEMFGYDARDTDRQAYNDALLPWSKFVERMVLVEDMSYMGEE